MPPAGKRNSPTGLNERIKLSDDRTDRTQIGLEAFETRPALSRGDSAPSFKKGLPLCREDVPTATRNCFALFVATLRMHRERTGERLLLGREAEAPVVLVPTHVPPRDERTVEIRLDRFRAVRKELRDDVL